MTETRWHLSSKARQSITHHWPRLTVAKLELATARLREDLQNDAAGAAKIRHGEILPLIDSAEAFLAQLDQVGDRARTLFGLQMFDGYMWWVNDYLAKILRAALEQGEDVASEARSDRRQRLGSRAGFILHIRAWLMCAGYGGSARANDDLVRLVGLLLDESGYPVADVRGTVRDAIKRAGEISYVLENPLPTEL